MIEFDLMIVEFLHQEHRNMEKLLGALEQELNGTVFAIHTRDFDNKGYVHHALEGHLQCQIKGDRTNYAAAHKRSALKRKTA